MKEDGIGKLFLRHLVIAIPWGIILLVVFCITAVSIKHQVKKAIQYGVRMAIYEVTNFAFDYHTVAPVKKNIKEGIEFTAKTAGDEVKALLNDPQVKEDLKEILKGSKNK